MEGGTGGTGRGWGSGCSHACPSGRSPLLWGTNHSTPDSFRGREWVSQGEAGLSWWLPCRGHATGTGRGGEQPGSGLQAQEVLCTKPLAEAYWRFLSLFSPLVYSLNSPHWVIQACSHQKKEVAVRGMADDQQCRQL